jgi:hypothetical protein
MSISNPPLPPLVLAWELAPEVCPSILDTPYTIRTINESLCLQNVIKFNVFGMSVAVCHLCGLVSCPGYIRFVDFVCIYVIWYSFMCVCIYIYVCVCVSLFVCMCARVCVSV